jgi:pimeloyl-ACP methyl ester carboxylesterase
MSQAFELPVHYQWNGTDYLGVLNRGDGRVTILAVLLPGSGPQEADCVVGPNRFMLQMATGLARRGIASLRFGKIAVGSAGPSPERYEDEYFGPVREMLRAAADKIPTDRLVLVGHSLGGHVAPALAERLASVRGVILLNANFSDLATELEAQIAAAEPAQMAAIEPLRGMLAKALAAQTLDQLDTEVERYFWNARRFDPARPLVRLRIPFLVIGCGFDAQVSAGEQVAWMTALAATGLPATRRDYPTLNHLAMHAEAVTPLSVLVPGTIDVAVLDDIADWIIELEKSG